MAPDLGIDSCSQLGCSLAMVPAAGMVCLNRSAQCLLLKLIYSSGCLLAAFESILGGGGMRPDCAGRSDRLLNVGPPKVAARFILGDSIEGGEPIEIVEVGDIGSGAGVAATDECVL